MVYFIAKKDEARAESLNCPISRKYSIELAREIKGKPANKVIKYLDDVIALKDYVPLKRFNSDVGHKRGEAKSGVKSGRYPIKVAKHFKNTLKSAIANADNRGLDSSNMLVVGTHVNKGIRRHKIQPQGRRRGRLSKATNVEILVKEMRLQKKSAPKKTSKSKSKASEKKE